MKAGRLRNRITVQQYANTGNDYGEPALAWSTYKTVFGELRAVTGREYLQADKVRADVSHVITIRHLDGLTPDMRMKFGDRYFDIIGILSDRTNARMAQVMCSEKVK